MSKPMPSPRGTNLEGLSMPGAVAAYDAAIEADTMKKVSDFLADKLTHEDHAAVLKMLGGDDTDDTESNMASDARWHRAETADLYRKGILNTREYESRLMSPPPRKATAADAARFAEMFPNAGRIKNL